MSFVAIDEINSVWRRRDRLQVARQFVDHVLRNVLEGEGVTAAYQISG
jgi:DNA polymerase elongation subunit (family B)